MQTKDYIIAIISVALGILIGWLIWHGKIVTHTGTTSNVASTSAVIPVETIKYVKVYIPIMGGVAAASKAIIPIVPASGSMKVRDNNVVIDMQCSASGTVEGTIYNNQIYGASGTTYIIQTASWTVKQKEYQSSNVMVGAAITTQGGAGVHVAYKLFETPPFLGLPGIDWTAGIVILK